MKIQIKKSAKIPGKEAGKKKVEKVMREYKTGKLHAGSKKGPLVCSRKQAIAIAMQESGQSKIRKKK